MIGDQSSSPLTHTIYTLGLWYAGYRLIISISLYLIFILTYTQHISDLAIPSLYFYTLITYCTLNFIQLFILKNSNKYLSFQLQLLFVFDVICLSLLSFTNGAVNVSISLLFIVTISASVLLLSTPLSRLITLFAIIVIVYQQLVDSLFNQDALNHISDSVLLAFLFCVVHLIVHVAVKRFKILENLTLHQSLEIDQLQNIHQSILEQVKDGYLVLDETFHVVVTNPSARKLLGIPTVYSSERTPLLKIHQDLFELLKFNDFNDGESFVFESQRSAYTIQIQVQRLIIPDQSFILLILKDAQKINQHAQQLKLAALGQLSSSIAHEIRNPLSAIVQANELLKSSDAQQQDTLSKIISKQCQRMNHIIENTLNMAKNERTFPEEISLDYFIPALLNEDLFDSKDKIKIDLQPKLKVIFDEKQLRQVLINLIRNALRHNSPEAAEIIFKINGKDSYVHIDVIDFGDGVTKRDISQLFKPFFSTENTGTGLGLYLSQSICEANQAKLMYVEQNNGACFRIRCSQAK